MIVRVLLAALVSAALLMVWGFLFWVVSPAGKLVLHPLPDQVAAIMPLLKDRLPQSGAYRWPCPGEPGQQSITGESAEQIFLRRHREGPIFTLLYSIKGSEPMSGATYLKGFLHNYLAAFLGAMVLAVAGRGLPTFGGRFALMLLVGLFAAVAIDISEPIWFLHPWDFHLAMGCFHFVNFAIVGAVSAAMVRPAAV